MLILVIGIATFVISLGIYNINMRLDRIAKAIRETR